VHRGARMHHQIHDVYELMVIAVARLGREVSGVDHALCDAIHHVACAIPWVDDPEAEPGITRFAAHEAYLSVIGVGQRLADAPPGPALDAARRAVDGVLDVLEPHVSGADRAVRAGLGCQFRFSVPYSLLSGE
jgi:hypothetical protein